MTIDLNAWNEQMKARWDPLRDQCAFGAWRDNELVGFQLDEPFEVGSAFKAFVAAEYARQVTTGAIDPDMYLTVQPIDRVESSLVMESIPDGGTIPIQEAAEAMIGASDNTATDMVIRVVGVENVRSLLDDIGLDSTTIPDSTKSIYDRVRQESGWRPQACLTTMRDLTRFYSSLVAGQTLGDEATRWFLGLMRQEDLAQGANWSDEVLCYRKSGMLEPPPLLAMGMTGAFLHVGGAVTAFAFALNVDFPEDAAFEDSPLEPTVRIFSEGLRLGLQELASG